MYQNIYIERVCYDLITNAVNITQKQRSMLFGFIDKYVAVEESPEGLYVLMDTLGNRDECSTNLKKALSSNFKRK